MKDSAEGGTAGGDPVGRPSFGPQAHEVVVEDDAVATDLSVTV